MYEGEVTEMTPEETESEAGGYGKVGSARIAASPSLAYVSQSLSVSLGMCLSFAHHACVD